jgi:hypothetical protein
MGLKWENNGFINLQGKSVLDIGGGPVSLLLKTHNSKVRTVVDPCHFPNWVNSRYNCAGVLFRSLKGEQILDWIEFNFDEVWMYNVLLHVQDPVKVINNAKAKSKIIRVVEYIHTEIQPGHPHTFTPKQLDEYFGGIGDIDNNPPSPVNSPIWYGVFKGDNYEKI